MNEGWNIVKYQSSYEYKFIEACESLGIPVKNGPTIAYLFEEESHNYFSDFETEEYIIEIKGSHCWYYRDLESGKLDSKNKAAIEYCKEHNKEFIFLLDIKDYIEVLGELYDD